MINTTSVLRIITWIEWIILLTIIALLFYISIPVKTEKVITLPQGSTSESIIAQLALEGYDVGTIDRFLLSKMGPIKSGEVRFGSAKNLSRVDFLYKLTQAKVPLLKITLIPGESTELFLAQVAKKLDINQTKLLEVYQQFAPYPEAAIAANTYLVPKKINEAKLIKFLLKNSQKQYKNLQKRYSVDHNSSSWQRILTIASIIQKEAANNKEMPLISSVIYNRLKKKMRLQMDGTLNYGKYAHIKVTPQRIREDNSTFNTYKHRGLPDSPVGAVSPAAIDAALHPAQTNYLYFMRNKRTGTHDFSSTFTKHRRNIRKVKHQLKK